MLSRSARAVLDIALRKYRPGRSDLIPVGGIAQLKPALQLMTAYRLMIQEVTSAEVVTSYTRCILRSLWTSAGITGHPFVARHTSGEKMRNTFGRQAIPMVWDYAEAYPLCESTGNWMAMADWTWKAFETTPANPVGAASQGDAQTQSISQGTVSTDPPYHDNIGYADLSDFWLRRSLKPIAAESLVEEALVTFCDKA